MDQNARIDYFRSEMEGKMAKLQKLIADQHTEHLKLLREFEKRLEKLTLEMKNVEMSVR